MESFKGLVHGRATPLEEKTKHHLFLMPGQSKKVTARTLVQNKRSLAAYVMVTPWRNLPHTFVAECIYEVDGYYGGLLSGGETESERTEYAVSEACAGCAMYSLLRRLRRGSARSKNKQLLELKAMVQLRRGRGHGLPALDSDETSEPEDGTSDVSDTASDECSTAPDAESVSSVDEAAPAWFAQMCKEDRVSLAGFLTAVKLEAPLQQKELLKELKSTWQLTDEQLEGLEDYLKVDSDEASTLKGGGSPRAWPDECTDDKQTAEASTWNDGAQPDEWTDDKQTAAELEEDSEGDGGVGEVFTRYPPPTGEAWDGAAVLDGAAKQLIEPLHPKEHKPKAPAHRQGKGRGKGKGCGKGKGKGRGRGNNRFKLRGKRKAPPEPAEHPEQLRTLHGISKPGTKDWHDTWLLKHAEALRSLPSECHPTDYMHGEKNYTVVNKENGASIQVRLTMKCFYLVKAAADWKGSKTFSWAKYDSPEEAWQDVKKAAGWTTATNSGTAS